MACRAAAAVGEGGRAESSGGGKGAGQAACQLAGPTVVSSMSACPPHLIQPSLAQQEAAVDEMGRVCTLLARHLRTSATAAAAQLGMRFSLQGKAPVGWRCVCAGSVVAAPAGLACAVAGRRPSIPPTTRLQSPTAITSRAPMTLQQQQQQQQQQQGNHSVSTGSSRAAPINSTDARRGGNTGGPGERSHRRLKDSAGRQAGRLACFDSRLKAAGRRARLRKGSTASLLGRPPGWNSAWAPTAIAAAAAAAAATHTLSTSASACRHIDRVVRPADSTVSTARATAPGVHPAPALAAAPPAAAPAAGASCRRSTRTRRRAVLRRCPA